MTPDNLAEIKAAAEKAIRPLVWEEFGLRWRAKTHLAKYMIWRRGSGYTISVNGQPLTGAYANEAAAKANADAYHVHCILSALDLDALVTELQQHRADPSSGKGEAVSDLIVWRSTVTDPPVAESCLARFFDNELGEWVYTVFDPGPVKISMAGPYSEWVPLAVFNRPLYAHPTPKATAPVTEEQVEAAARALASRAFARVSTAGKARAAEVVSRGWIVYADDARAALEAAAPSPTNTTESDHG